MVAGIPQQRQRPSPLPINADLSASPGSSPGLMQFRIYLDLLFLGMRCANLARFCLIFSFLASTLTVSFAKGIVAEGNEKIGLERRILSQACRVYSTV